MFFGTAAASSAAPAGILNGVSATTPSAVTPQSEALRLDLQALIAALTSPSDPVFIDVAEPLGLCVVGVTERVCLSNVCVVRAAAYPRHLPSMPVRWLPRTQPSRDSRCSANADDAHGYSRCRGSGPTATAGVIANGHADVSAYQADLWPCEQS